MRRGMRCTISRIMSEELCLLLVKTRSLTIWHKHLRRLSSSSLTTLSIDFGFKLKKNAFECSDICHRAKQTWSTLPVSDSKANRPFALIHCDMWGYYWTPSLNSCHYFLCIVDDYTRALWVYLLKDKMEVYEELVDFCSLVQTQFDLLIQKVRSDNGMEFTNRPLQTYFHDNGIVQENSYIDTPQ